MRHLRDIYTIYVVLRSCNKQAITNNFQQIQRKFVRQSPNQNLSTVLIDVVEVDPVLLIGLLDELFDVLGTHHCKLINGLLLLVAKFNQLHFIGTVQQYVGFACVV